MESHILLLIPLDALPAEGNAELVLLDSELGSPEERLLTSWMRFAATNSVTLATKGNTLGTLTLQAVMIMSDAQGQISVVPLPLFSQMEVWRLSEAGTDSVSRVQLFNEHLLSLSKILKGLPRVLARPLEDGIQFAGILMEDVKNPLPSHPAHDGGSAASDQNAHSHEVEGHGVREWVFAAALGLTLPEATGAETGSIQQVVYNPETDRRIKRDEATLSFAKENLADVKVIVDLSRQRAYLIVGHRIALETPVCTGKTGRYETPEGTFTITERIRDGKISNLYRCELPFWMRLTNGGIGLHVGKIENQPSSHGCIRLPEEAAKVIFDHTQRSTTVIVTRSADHLLPRPSGEWGDMVAAVESST